MTLNDTRMLLEDAVRMQAPRAVWGGVARRKNQYDLAIRYLAQVLREFGESVTEAFGTK